MAQGCRRPVVRLCVRMHRLGELVSLLLNPVGKICTATRHHQHQKDEKRQDTNDDFYRRIATLGCWSCGRGRNDGPGLRGGLSGAALVTEFGSVRQRISTTYTESSHFVPFYQRANVTKPWSARQAVSGFWFLVSSTSVQASQTSPPIDPGATRGDKNGMLIPRPAVWQKATAMVTEIYRRTQGFPRQEMFGLTSQLR